MQTEIVDKVCDVCGESLPTPRFQRHAMTKDGYLGTCKACMGKKARAGMNRRNGGGAIIAFNGEKSPERPRRQPVLMEADELEHIPSAFLPDRLLSRAREFTGAAELCKRGWEVKFLNTKREEEGADLEIRLLGKDGPWIRINVCGEASAEKVYKDHVKTGGCDFAMWFDEVRNAWMIKGKRGEKLPGIKITYTNMD